MPDASSDKSGTVIYGVSSGAYSDYQVLSVFESQEDAENYVREMNGGDSYASDELRVETFPFYPSGHVPTVNAYWRAAANSDDDDIDVREERTDEPTTQFERPQASAFPRTDGTVYFEARCVDREAAIKSVADRQAQWKAAQ